MRLGRRSMQLRPVLYGWGVGFALILLALLSYQFNLPEGAGMVVARAFIIYPSAGLTTGLYVRSVAPHARDVDISPLSHALATGFLLVLTHALLLYANSQGNTPSLYLFAAEAPLALLLAVVGGWLGGRHRRR